MQTCHHHTMLLLDHSTAAPMTGPYMHQQMACEVDGCADLVRVWMRTTKSCHCTFLSRAWYCCCFSGLPSLSIARSSALIPNSPSTCRLRIVTAYYGMLQHNALHSCTDSSHVSLKHEHRLSNNAIMLVAHGIVWFDEYCTFFACVICLHPCDCAHQRFAWLLVTDLLVERVESELSCVVCASQRGDIAAHHAGVGLAIILTVPLPILLNHLHKCGHWQAYSIIQ